MGQPEGNIGHTQYGSAALLLDFLYNLQCGSGGGIIRAHGHGQGIYYNIFPLNAVAFRSTVDFLRNGKTSLGCRGNTGFVQSQSHHHSAVFPYQRKDFLHNLFLAVYGVNHGLSVVNTHCRFHCLCIGGVNLQRKGQDPLQLVNRLLHHRHFVNFRQSYIDVQNICSGIRLLYALFENIFHIVVTECLLEFRFTGRINSFPDNRRFPAKKDCLGIRSHNSIVLLCESLRYKIPAFFRQCPDMGGSGTAAATGKPGAHGNNLSHIFRKFRRVHIVNGSSVFHSRKSRIGHDNQGNGRKLRQSFKNGLHLLGTETAVDTEGIHPETLEKRHHVFRGSAGQKLVSFVKYHGCHYRQAAVFLCRQHCCL